MSFTGSDVFEQLKKDPSFRAQPEPVLAAMRPYVEHLPELLNDVLDQPATLESLLSAQVRFLRYSLDNDYIIKLVRALPEEYLEDSNREKLILEMQTAFTAAMAVVDEMADGLVETLLQYGLTEQQVMAGPKVGLNSELFKMYLDGTLTVGEILRQQPAVIMGTTR